MDMDTSSSKSSSTDHYVGSVHIENLKKMCRVCGCKSKKIFTRLPFSEELLELYKVSFIEESGHGNIYPSVICNGCRMHCIKYRNAKNKGIKFTCKIPALFEFSSHQDGNCRVCNRGKGRPSKKLNEVTFDFANERSQTITSSLSSNIVLSETDTASENEMEKCLHRIEPCPSSSFDDCDLHIFHNNSETDTASDTETHDSMKRKAGFETNDPSSVKFSKKEPTVFDVSRVLDFDETFPTFSDAELTSLSLDRATEHRLAEIMQCSICKGLPTEPMLTHCNHLFCKNCIYSWLKIGSSCPVCRKVTDVESDVSKLTGHMLLMYETLHVTCCYSNCNEILTLNEIVSHESNCKYGKYPEKFLTGKSNKTRGEGQGKIPLYDCKSKYLRQKRLKPIMQFVTNFCQDKHENIGDVLFFMLTDHLNQANDQRSKVIDSLWRGDKSPSLTAHECLALRIDTLQSKTQYRSQYEFLKQKSSFNPYQPPHTLDLIECQYMPASTRYSLEGQEFFHTFYHTPAKPKNLSTAQSTNVCFEPLDILSDFHISVPEMPCPNVKGVRWCYPDAVAKTLQELETDFIKGLEEKNIDPNDPSLILKTYIKDGADGLGDVAVHKETGDRYLPDKAFRFSFCVFKSEAIIGDRVEVIFLEEKPNSVRTNKPLLEAICDENSKASSMICLQMIENERKFMKDKILRVQIPNGWRRHLLQFFNSMIDEKLDRSCGGLSGSGSSYLCTLCYATRETAKSQLGTFKISRTVEETSEIATYIRVNPDNLSKLALDKISKGVKSVPLLQTDANEKCLDATHADINCGSFFKKLIIREIAHVNTWDATEDIQAIIKNAEVKFDICLKKFVGINPQLMMPGNYSRTLFDLENEKYMLSLISDIDRKQKLSELLTKFRFMRKVYMANDPKVQYPEETKLYKQTAIAFGQSLIENFSYAKWPNYIHKVIEHVQELIDEGPGTVGGLSGEGNEGGNKIFRHFRKNLARRGNTYRGLRDVLWGHWLYSSPELVRLANKTNKKKKCRLCLQEGHNVRSCKLQIENAEPDQASE